MPAADVVRLRVGLAAIATLEGFGDKPFNGRITRISPTAQAGSRSIPVYVEILDRDDGLRGGLFGMGRVTTAETAGAIAVPAAAMRKDETGSFVLAVADGALVRKPVETVRPWLRGELIEVKGLDEGQVIVAAPLPGLKAGQKVKTVETH